MVPPPRNPSPRCALAQWIGKRREQEDTVLSATLAGGTLGIVCDGMGGHARGAEASSTAAHAFLKAFRNSLLTDVPERLFDALSQANESLIPGQGFPGESGTTLLAVFIRDGLLWWVSVGDSPLYLWNSTDDGPMDRLNADHSMRPIADALYKNGTMSLQRALRQRSVLRSALMGGDIEMTDLPAVPLHLHPGDVILACSDGLQPWCEFLRKPSFDALRLALQEGSTEGLCTRAIEQTKEMLEPGQDNASLWAAYIP